MRSQPLRLFLYRLALEMKIWNVEEWSRQITTEQLKWWLAFYRIEPFGQAWRRLGRAVAILGAVWTGKISEDAEERFLPTYRADRPQSDAEIIAELSKSPLFRKSE